MTLDHSSHVSKKRKRKESGDREHHDYPEVALEQLQINTLRRYKRYFKLQTRQGLTKVQLSESVVKHFRSIQVNEKEAITYFLYMVKMNRNRLDNKTNGTDDLYSRDSRSKNDK